MASKTTKKKTTSRKKSATSSLEGKKAPKKSNNMQIEIPYLEKNQSVVLSNIDGNLVMGESAPEIQSLDKGFNYDDVGLGIEIATFDVDKLKHIYNKMIQKENSSYVTTPEELKTLAQNVQMNKDNIIKINGIAKYYINKEDLIGRVVDTIENNANIRYSVEYPKIPATNTKKGKKLIENLKTFINNFNQQINIEQLIVDNLSKTYTEGNSIYYLMGDAEKGYQIVPYPLDIVDITDRTIDGDPILAFNVRELKQRLSQSQNKYGKMKSQKLVEILNVEGEIERDYPVEVYEAFKAGDEYTYLDPARAGVCRINNMGQQYGLTPIFRALSPLLMLETYDNVDRANAIAKSKKIYFQKLSSELLGKDGKNTKHQALIGYAHTSLMSSLGTGKSHVYTGAPYVDRLEIIEPTVKETPAETIMAYRNRVLNAVGIGFLSSESSNSMNTTTVNVDELLKTVNKISRQLESLINKFYKQVCLDNGLGTEFAPTLSIESTSYINFADTCKLVDMLYGKLGLSYQTIFEKLGMDYNTEVNRRVEENNFEGGGITKVFVPYATSFNTGGNNQEDNSNVNEEVNENNSKKSSNKDKSSYDKQRQKSIAK